MVTLFQLNLIRAFFLSLSFYLVWLATLIHLYSFDQLEHLTSLSKHSYVTLTCITVILLSMSLYHATRNPIYIQYIVTLCPAHCLLCFCSQQSKKIYIVFFLSVSNNRLLINICHFKACALKIIDLAGRIVDPLSSITGLIIYVGTWLLFSPDRTSLQITFCLNHSNIQTNMQHSAPKFPESPFTLN